jgi:hypothetical protein
VTPPESCWLARLRRQLRAERQCSNAHKTWRGMTPISASSTTLTGAERSPHVRLHGRRHERSSPVQRRTGLAHLCLAQSPQRSCLQQRPPQPSLVEGAGGAPAAVRRCRQPQPPKHAVAQATDGCRGRRRQKRQPDERQRAQAARDRQTARGERGKLRRGYGADSRRRIRLSARAALAEARQ